MLINYDRKEDLFKTTHIIDKIHHPDSEIVRCYGKEVRLGDLRTEVAKFEKCTSYMTVFYDDIVQYTSLGLLDILFDEFNIAFPLPIKEFFERQCTGNDFVKQYAKMFGIENRLVDAIEKKYYSQILARSPFSKNAKAFLSMREMLSGQVFVFRYRFPGDIEILQKLKEANTSKLRSDYVSLEIASTNGKSEKDYISSLKIRDFDKYEIVVIQDAGSLMEIFDKKNINLGSKILTTMNHNMLSYEQMETVLSNPEGYGNGDYTIDFMEEGIVS